ncbi:MAG: ABC transporter permease [Polyangiaceae bacterium]
MRTSEPPPSSRRVSLMPRMRRVARVPAPLVSLGTRVIPVTTRFGRDIYRLLARHVRQSRLARVGFAVLLGFVFVAVFADFLASSSPIACRWHGETHWFPNVRKPDGMRGKSIQDLRKDAEPSDWIVPPLVPYGPRQRMTLGTSSPLVPPFATASHPLGTDGSGRDVFARVVHGARTSLGFAFAAVFAFGLVGCVVGAFAGFFGGVADAIVSRLVELLSAFPTLLLVLVVQATLPEASTFTMLVTLALTRWTEVARLVRAEVLRATSEEYVVAARALGASPARVLFRHVLPNVLVPAIVSASLGTSAVVLVEATLDFLHVGVPSSTASWGALLGDARSDANAWWLLAFPGLCLFATTLAFNLVGEALRDALDPRLTRTSFGPSR